MGTTFVWCCHLCSCAGLFMNKILKTCSINLHYSHLYLLHNQRLVCKGLVQFEHPTYICREKEALSKAKSHTHAQKEKVKQKNLWGHQIRLNTFEFFS